ncbi:hypothetical protein TRVA0_051S00298 [Trichomonascus vanleenenianus]|uniref:uncharacterized protein n=1 Tax=Trichomonascus vanleenenianus TaxID=2268995 RepID=UPI003EC99C37
MTGSAEHDQVARQLKESLLKSKTQVDRDNIAGLINSLVEASPEGNIPEPYVPMVELAYSLAYESFDLDARRALYRSLVNRENLSGLLKCSTITRLYANLAESETDDASAMVNGLYFILFLRAQERVTESMRLLDVLLTKHKLVNDVVVMKYLRDLESHKLIDVAILDKLLKDSRLLVHQQVRQLETVHEMLTVYSETIASSSQQGSEEYRKFGDFVCQVIIPLKSHLAFNTETSIILLDACLNFSEPQSGTEVLEKVVAADWDSVVPQDDESRVQFLELVLAGCSRFGTLQLGDKVYNQLLEEEPAAFVKETWDVMAQWRLRASNGNLDEMKSTLAEMQEQEFDPDDASLNGIIQTALAMNLDNLFIKAAIDHFKTTFHVDGDIDTYAALIRHSLGRADVETAHKLFDKSLTSGSQWDNKNGRGKAYLTVLDDLIVAMCRNSPEKYDTTYTFKYFQKVKMFTPTVGYQAQLAMIKMFLDGDYVPDAGRFLEDELGDRTGIPHDKVPELYTLLNDYIMTTANYELAWLLYGYMSKYIKLPYESYLPAMLRFCEIKRPDAAMLIFKYLRARQQKEGLLGPSEEMYRVLFSEFGRMMYEDGINQLHMFFKMDIGVEATVPLLNSAMNAYAGLHRDNKVYEIWTQLESFPGGGGINNESITVLLRHLTRSSIEDVERLWLDAKREYNVDLDEQNWRQYLISNCYHGYYMRALNLVKEMEAVHGITPSDETIEALYNWTMIESRKENVRQWALEHKPEAWKRLEAMGTLKEYVLPPDSDGSSEESRRAETIGLLENDNQEKHRYLENNQEKHRYLK